MIYKKKTINVFKPRFRSKEILKDLKTILGQGGLALEIKQF